MRNKPDQHHASNWKVQDAIPHQEPFQFSSNVAEGKEDSDSDEVESNVTVKHGRSIETVGAGQTGMILSYTGKMAQ